MVEFSAAASLGIEIEQGALRDARRQIENELGDVTVGVSGSAAPSGQPRDPQTGQFVSGMGAEEYERRDLTLSEDRNALLEDIADAMDGGAAFGGGTATVMADGGGGGGGGILDVLGGGFAGRFGAGALGGGALGGLGAGGAAATAGAAGIAFGAGHLGVQGLRGLMGNEADEPVTFGQVAGDIEGRLSNVDIQTPGWVNDLLGWNPPPVEVNTPESMTADAFGVTDDGTFGDLRPIPTGRNRPNTDAMGTTATERAILAGRSQERDPRLTGQDIGFQGVNVDVTVGDTSGNARRDVEAVARREAERVGERLKRYLERNTPGAGTQPRNL